MHYDSTDSLPDDRDSDRFSTARTDWDDPILIILELLYNTILSGSVAHPVVLMTGYAIVLASGQLERLQAVANIASIAAASDIPVDVFATMDGLEAFDIETVESGDFEMGAVAKAMMDSEKGEMPLFTDSLEQAKEIGPIALYACELSMDLLDRTLDDYVDLFDDVLGVSGFLTHAQDKQVVFV